MAPAKRSRKSLILRIFKWDMHGSRIECLRAVGKKSQVEWMPIEITDNIDDLVLYEFWMTQDRKSWPYPVRRRVIEIENENKLGCSPKLRHLGNPENWVSVYEALKFVRKYEHFESYCDSLDCQMFDGEIDEMKDMIYLRPLANYLFVYVSLPKQKLCIVMDGENYYLGVNPCSALPRIVGYDLKAEEKTVRSIKFIGQTEVDHCVSSAAIIVLACKELYKNNPKEWPDSIKADPFKWSESVKFMNYKKGVPLPNYAQAANDMPGCPKCGDRRPKWREANLKTHIELCDGKTTKRRRN